MVLAGDGAVAAHAHPILFWVNVVMIVYTIWGYLSPIDFFWHPGHDLLPRGDLQHGGVRDRHVTGSTRSLR
jgi:hypothetical protein